MSSELKSVNGRLGHIKRRLLRGESLTRDLLELAQELVGDGNSGDELMDGIANKLNAGKELSEYELHLMVDVFLPHAKLGNARRLASE
ncbi:hypothetical protein D3C72_2027380 [compost metagenome]